MGADGVRKQKKARRHKGTKPRGLRDGAGGFSRYGLYELTVQNPGALVPLLAAIHGGKPRVLAEDFCGTAALAREWVKRIKGGRASATDIDPEPLAVARRALGRGRERVRLIKGDVLASGPARASPAEVIFVGNFSIGEIHERPALVRYLRRARERLTTQAGPARPGRKGGGGVAGGAAAHTGGVFICDTYGGDAAFKTGAVQRIHPVPGNPATRIRYTWQQREADPLRAMVENVLHFRVERAGEIVQELTDAFIYRWRLWSLSELRDAMHEAGFKRVDIYNKMPDATDGEGNAYVLPVTDPDELGDNWIVCVAARA